MQVRTSGWILVASGIAITALFACSEGQWAKEPLPTCDEGDEGCGSGGKNSSTNKGGKSKAPSGTPTPAETQSTTEANNDDNPPAGNTTTTPDASTSNPLKDAGGTPPTKGPNCLSNQNTCIAVTLKCGCPEDCCAGTVCAQVGGLVQNTCCKITASPCTSHSECCGQLLCKPNTSGTGMSCQ